MPSIHEGRSGVGGARIVTAPTYANGKICYIELPASDVSTSAAFYRSAFGWDISNRGDGTTSFTDTVGQVSGSFVTGVAPNQPGLVVSIMVADMTASIAAVEANGGVITQPVGKDHPEITARFRDPAGNIMGLYQERSLSE
jgi:predicted enzyme related to lactoylglutathione lyase